MYDGQFKIHVVEYIQAYHLSYREAAAKFGILEGSPTISKRERIYYEKGSEALYRDRHGKVQPNKPELSEKENFSCLILHNFPPRYIFETI